VVVLAAAQPSISAGRSDQATGRSGRGIARGRGHQTARLAAVRACRPRSRANGYVNPLAAAAVTPKRIDQGVDYAGSGALVAIGEATVTYIATSDTGWPGAFIEYQLRSGPEAGCYVYYAEGVIPTGGLRVGEQVRAGEAIATLDPGNPSGIEIGWGSGAGTQTYAAMAGQWSATSEQDNLPSGAGASFSSLIAALGGPPGKVGVP